MKFLSNYFGRGVYNIYMATIVCGNLTGDDFIKLLSIIIAIFMFASGIAYIFSYACCKGGKNESLLENWKYIFN